MAGDNNFLKIKEIFKTIFVKNLISRINDEKIFKNISFAFNGNILNF